MRWTPVSEKLPELVYFCLATEYSETVLALTDNAKVMAAVLKKMPGGEQYWIAPFEFWDAENETITHWMEIPSLPHNNKKDE